MNCSRCNNEIAEDEIYVYQGKILCEDCLMDIGASTKECDPWATYVDTRTRKQHGETGTASLTQIEANIYELVKSKGRATRNEIMKELNLSEIELDLQLRPLMHSELIKEHSEGGLMYLITIG